MRVGPGRRDRHVDPAGVRELTVPLDRLLRQALEAAVAVARAGEEDTPAVQAPAHLRPFLHFAKLPARAVVAARRAVEGDEDFRARVADAVSEDDVGRAGWLWLTRPEGWEAELDALQQDAAEAGEVAADRKAESEARRRLAGAEAAAQRAEVAAAVAQAESVRAASALAEERRARRAAVEEADELGRRLEQVSAERDRARAERDRLREDNARAGRRVADLKEALEELRNAPPPEPPPPEPPPPAQPAALPEEVARAATALLDAAGAAASMAESLRRAATTLGAIEESPERAPAPPAPEPAPAFGRRPRAPRRVPVPLPPGVLDDSPEAADHLIRVPRMTLLVDGYNVSQRGWPDYPIAEQRRRLVDALTELATRTGADVSVVFDGAEPTFPTAVPTTSRLVKVSFSPPDVEADDVVLARVGEVGPSRPVVVASSDRRVRDGATAQGANVISSVQLLAALRR